MAYPLLSRFIFLKAKTDVLLDVYLTELEIIETFFLFEKCTEKPIHSVSLKKRAFKITQAAVAYTLDKWDFVNPANAE